MVSEGGHARYDGSSVVLMLTRDGLSCRYLYSGPLDPHIAGDSHDTAPSLAPASFLAVLPFTHLGLICSCSWFSPSRVPLLAPLSDFDQSEADVGRFTLHPQSGRRSE